MNNQIEVLYIAFSYASHQGNLVSACTKKMFKIFQDIHDITAMLRCWNNNAPSLSMLPLIFFFFCCYGCIQNFITLALFLLWNTGYQRLAPLFLTLNHQGHSLTTEGHSHLCVWNISLKEGLLLSGFVQFELSSMFL